MPWGKAPTWKDQLGPAYAFAQGAAQPTMTVIAGSTFIRGLCFAPGDRVDVAVQFDHDVDRPSGEAITFHPHVHFSFVDQPTAGNTVRWKFTFRGAKPSFDGSVSFPSTQSTVSSTRFVCTSTEALKHYVKALSPITVASSDYDESYMLWGTFELSTLSTIAANLVNLLSFDIHKRCRNNGAGSVDEWNV